jgi:hypothetical protein
MRLTGPGTKTIHIPPPDPLVAVLAYPSSVVSLI